MKILNKIAIGLIKFYKRFISPLLPPACRFEPTCSVYALQCYQRYSIFKASYLTLKRILRCQPFCAGGYDPVPDDKKDCI